MPKVIYRGPTNRLEIDDLVLDRDGEPVELSDDQLVRAQGIPEAMFELEDRIGGARNLTPSSTSPSGAPPVQPPSTSSGGSE